MKKKCPVQSKITKHSGYKIRRGNTLAQHVSLYYGEEMSKVFQILTRELMR